MREIDFLDVWSYRINSSWMFGDRMFMCLSFTGSNSVPVLVCTSWRGSLSSYTRKGFGVTAGGVCVVRRCGESLSR